MTPRILIRQPARADLLEQAQHIARDSMSAAMRLLLAAEQAFEGLARFPLKGTARRFSNPKFAGMRSWPIPGFERHVIFYRPIAEGVEILRVIHASRNLGRLLGKERK